MNPRITAIVTGIVTLALGLGGLLYPERVMGVLGFTIATGANGAAVLGEVRATYGGLFVVAGIFTLATAIDPAGARGRLLFLGLLWLGACAGRLLGTYADGSPGLPGWLGVVFELLMGGALLAAAFRARTANTQHTMAPAAPVSSLPAGERQPSAVSPGAGA